MLENNLFQVKQSALMVYLELYLETLSMRFCKYKGSIDESPFVEGLRELHTEGDRVITNNFRPDNYLLTSNTTTWRAWTWGFCGRSTSEILLNFGTVGTTRRPQDPLILGTSRHGSPYGSIVLEIRLGSKSSCTDADYTHSLTQMPVIDFKTAVISLN
ncbi:hypothetical protein L7F22_000494 [Adiantum nelumboides]|nr:hypothetical protein [Adiantum nelumboides]